MIAMIKRAWRVLSQAFNDSCRHQNDWLYVVFGAMVSIAFGAFVGGATWKITGKDDRDLFKGFSLIFVILTVMFLLLLIRGWFRSRKMQTEGPPPAASHSWPSGDDLIVRLVPDKRSEREALEQARERSRKVVPFMQRAKKVGRA